MLHKMTPTDVEPFEPRNTRRKKWSEIRKKIEANAREKYLKEEPDSTH